MTQIPLWLRDYLTLALCVLVYIVLVSIPALAIILPWYSLLMYGG